MSKENIVLLVNGILAAGLFVLVGLGKVDWPQCMIGLGLLLAPSALQRGASS